MSYKLTVHFSREEVINAWADQVDYKEWFEIYLEVFNSYGSWSVSIELAEAIVKHLQEGYLKENYEDKSIPDLLKPLVSQAIIDGYDDEVVAYSDMSEEDGHSDIELAARDFAENKKDWLVDHDSLYKSFEAGAEWYKDTKEVSDKVLGDYTTEELLEELKARM